MQPRPKLLPYMLGGEGSPLAAVAAEAARAAAASTPPASLSPVRTPPISSPTSAATGGPKLSSLLGSGGAAPGDCALSAEPPQAGWHC